MNYIVLYTFAALLHTNDEDGEVLVRVFGYGDCDGLHSILVLKVDLPPALPARLGRETAGVGVAVGRQFGVVVPQRRRLLRRSPQGQVPTCKSSRLE